MAKRKTPGQIIDYWAPRLGLDDRAVEVVAGGEGGLKWGTVGDGGYAHGPFQQNAAGGVLTRRWRTQGREKAIAYANSEAGMVEAMRAMAAAGARGQTGLQAVSTIISKYERPKDIPGSIEKARARWKAWGYNNQNTPTNPRHASGAEQSMPSSPVFGLDASTSGVEAQRKAAAEFFRSRAMARVQGAAVPGISTLASTLRTIRQQQNVEDSPPVDFPTPSSGEVPSTARPKGGGDKPFVLRAGDYALSLGLSVRENPYYDKVDPVHTEGSDHYRTAGSYRGREYGSALDVSGNPEKQRRFFKWLEANRGQGLDDMFHDPMGYSYDEGNRWGKTIGGHGKHVHASFR